MLEREGVLKVDDDDEDATAATAAAVAVLSPSGLTVDASPI